MTDLQEGFPTFPSLPPFRTDATFENPSRISLPRVQEMDQARRDVSSTPVAQMPCPAKGIPLSVPPQSQSESSSGAATPPSTAATFHPVNPKPAKKRTPKKTTSSANDRTLAPLAPALPRTLQSHSQPRPLAPRPQPSTNPNTIAADGRKNFYDIPPELRVEIYKLTLESVTIHILPREAGPDRRAPHALTRTSRTVRNEVLPIIHSSCSMVAVVTDFNFTSLLDFMARIPPHEQKALVKNPRLTIKLCTTGCEKQKSAAQAVSDTQSLRTWLHDRADPYRPQPRWEYCGPRPSRRVESDLRRRINRMSEEGKRNEMIKLAKGIGMERVGIKGRAGGG